MDAKTNMSGGVSQGVRGASVRRLLCRAEWVRLGALGVRTRRLGSLGGWSAAAVSLAVLLSNPSTAMAAPEGEQVSRGSVSFVRSGGETIITASNNSVINYRSFDIAANETVRFVQPDAASRVLNRINSAAPTRIDGGLFANGRVYIVNPAGVIFGRNAVVDVAGLHAAAGRMSDADFLRGTDRFTNMSGQVINQGSITGDFVALLGKSVFNAGSINAPEGTVVMAAGDSVLIGPRDGGLMVRVEGSAIVGEGGAAVKNDGTINTTGATGGTRGGRVMMAAGDVWGVALGTGSSSKITSRDVKIEGQGKGVVNVQGTINATNTGATNSGANPGQNSPTNTGKGGDVRVLGEFVAVDGAVIDASGATGGGTVLVGGNYMGQGSERNATRTFVSDTAEIRADATVDGNGGRVILWSNEATWSLGAISARGAGQGRGGFVETSSKGFLDVRTTPDVTSPSGKGGTWLIDPTTVNIIAGNGAGSMVNTAGTFNVTGTPASSNLGVDLITAALTGGSTVTINTTSGGAGAGDINLNTTLDFNGTGAGTLILNAVNDINFTAGNDVTDSNTGTNDSLNLTLNAGGNVNIDDSTVNTRGGDFISNGVGFTIDNGGALIDTTGSVAGSGGDIQINHTGAVDIQRALNSDGGAITVTGTTIGLSGGSGNIDAGAGSATVTAGDAFSIANNRFISADTSILIQSGANGGDDNITFGGNSAFLQSASITLRAGNGGSASVVDFSGATGGAASFLGAAGAGTRPTTFNVIQDAAITSLVGVGEFGASISGMNYGVQSDSSVLLDDAAAVAGTNLTINGATSVTIDDATTDPFSVGTLTINGTDLAVGGAFAGGTVDIAEQTTASGAFISNGTTFVNTGALSATGFTLEHSGNVDIDANITSTGAGGFASNRTSQAAGTFDSDGFTIDANNGNVAIVAPSQTVTLGQILDGAAVNVGGAGITTNGTIGAGSVDLQSTAAVSVNAAITTVGAGFVSAGTTFDSIGAGDIDTTAGSGILDINHTGAANIAGDLLGGGVVTVDAGATTLDGAASSATSSVAFNVNGIGTFNGTVGSATNTTIIANDALAINGDVDAGNGAGNTVRLVASADGGNDNLTFGSDGVLLSGNAIFLQAGNGAGATAEVDLATLGTGATASFLGGNGGATNPATLTIVQDASMTSANIPIAAEFGGGSLAGLNLNLQSSGGSVSLTDAAAINGTNLVVNGATSVTLDEATNATFTLASLIINGTNPLTASPFVGASVDIDDAVTTTGTFTSNGTTFQNTAAITASGITLEHSGTIDIDANVTATGVGGFVSNRTAETAGAFDSTGSTIDGGTGPVTVIAPSQSVTLGAITNAGAITATGSAITQTGTVTSSTSYDANGGTVAINGAVTVSGAFTSDGTTFANTAAISASGITLEHSGTIDIDANVTATGVGGFVSDRTAEGAGAFDSAGFTIDGGTGPVTVIAPSQSVTLGAITNAGAITATGSAITQTGNVTSSTSYDANGGTVAINGSVAVSGAFTSDGTTFVNGGTITADSITLEHSGTIGINANVTATGVGGFVSDRTAETSGTFNSSLATIDGGTGPVTVITNGSDVIFGAITNAGAITGTGTTVTQAGIVSSSTSYTANGGAVSINTAVTVSGAFTSSGTTFNNGGTINAASVALEHSGDIDIDAGITTGAGGFTSDRTAEASGVFDSDGVTIDAGTGNVTVVAAAQNVVMGTISNAATILISGAAVSQNGSATGRAYTLNATGDANINGNITANDTGTPANSLVVINAGSDGTGDVIAGAVEIRGQGISFRAGDGAGGTDTATVQIASVTLADRTGVTNPGAVTIRQDASIAAADIPLLATFTGGAVTAMNYTLQSDAGSVDVGANAARVAGSRLTLSALNTGQSVAWTSDLSVQSLTVNGVVPNLTNSVTASNGDIVLNLQNTLTTVGANVTLSAVSAGNGTGLIDINSGAANAIEIGTNELTLRGTEIDLNGLAANSITGGAGSSLRLETSTTTQAINVGTIGSPQAGALDLTAADLQTIDASVEQLTIGRADGAHVDIVIGDATFVTDTLVRTPSGGLINLVGDVENTTTNAEVSFIGNTFLTSGSITTANGLVDFQSPVFLNSTLYTIDTGSATGGGAGSVRVRQGAELDFAASGNTLRLITGAVTFDLADGVTGNNSNLDLRPEITNGSISVGSGVGAADLAVDASVLTGLADGFGNLNLGTAGGSHAVELGSFAIRDPLAINLGAGGSVLISGTVSGAASTVGNPGSLTITSPATTLGSAGGGAIDLLTGSFTLNGPLTVDDAASRSIATDSGNIDLNGEVDSSGDGTATLTLDSGTGDIILRDEVGGNFRFLTFSILNAGDVNPIAEIAGTPNTINAININQTAGTGISRFGALNAGDVGAASDRITLAGTQFSFLGAIATNAGTNSGNMVLTNSGAATIDAGITLNGSFDQNGAGAVSLGANIDTTAGNGSISFDGPVTMTQASTQSAGTGTIAFNDSLDLGTFLLELVADEIDFLGGASSVTGSSTATLVLRPSADGVSIGVGGGAGTLDISDVDLLALASGAMDSLLIGNGTTGNHAITIGTSGDGALFRNAVNFRSPNGSITVDGTITGENDLTNVGVTTDNPIVLNAGITTTGGFISLASDVSLGAGLSNFSNVAILDTTNAGADAAGADVSINGTINATASNAQGIDINAGTGGNVELGGDIGSAFSLLRFAINNANTVNAVSAPVDISAVTIRQDAGTGAARYATLTAGAGGVDLNANSFTLSGDITSGGAIDIDAANGQFIALAGGDRIFTTTTPGSAIAIDAVDGNANTLTLTSAGDVTLRGDVTDMSDFSSSGDVFTLASTALITTADSVTLTHTGNVNLNGNVRTTAASGVINIAAGTDDTGNVLFGEGVSLSSDIIVLAAGNGSGGTNLAFVDADGSTLTTRPTYFNSANDNRPVDFRIQQDLAIADADLPDAAQFGGVLGGVTPMVYRLVTLDTITIDTASKVDGANLILTAGNGIIINGAIAPGQVRFNNSVTLNNSIDTGGTGDIQFDDGGSAGGDITLSAGDDEIIFNGGAFNIGTNDVALVARDVQINTGASVTGTGGTLNLSPDTDGVNIRIGGASDTADFDITADELGRLTATGEDRFSLLTIGRQTGTATIFIDGASNFFDPFSLVMDGAGGTIRVDNALAARENATASLVSPTVRLASSLTSQGQDITIDASTGVLVDADNVAIDATNSGGTPAGADITVNAPIDSDDGAQASPGNRDFAINAGTGGSVFVQGAIGATDELSTVTISAGNGGGIDIDLLDVRTSGAQTYNAGRVAVNDDLTSLVAGAITINGNLILQSGTDADTTITTAGSAATDDVVITGVIDTQIGSGERELIIDVGTGDILVGGDIGFNSFTPDLISDLDFAANTISIQGVRTSGTQTYDGTTLIAVDGDSFGTVIEYNGPTRIDSDLTVTGSTSVSFNGTVVSQTAEGNDLAVTSPQTTFADNLGGDNGQNLELGTLTTDAVGTTIFGQSGPAISIRTLGAQTFADAVNLAANATFTSVNAGVAFNSTLNSAGGARTLVIDTGSNGVTRFGSTVGNSGVLASITTNADGTVRFNGNVTTSGDQTYNDAAVLETNATFTGAGITLAAGVDSATTPSDLTIAATNAVTIGANSGAGVGLRNVLVTGTSINTRSVRSSNAQTYNGPTTLNGTLASISSGSINVNGALTLAGNSALTTSGGSGSDVAITGAITGGGFDLGLDAGALGNLTLGGNASGLGALSARGVTVSFADIDTAGDTLIAATNFTAGANLLSGGNLTIGGNAGGGSVQVILRRARAVGQQQVTADTIILGGNQGSSTSGAIAFNGPVVLDTDVTVDSGAGVTFANTVDTRASVNLRNLTVNTGANSQTLFVGNVGGIRELANLTTNADGTTRFNGTIVNTNSDQVYNDAVLVAANTVFSGNDVAFASSLNPTASGIDLNVRTADAGVDAGEASFAGNVGDTTAFRTITTQLRAGVSATDSPNAATVLGGVMHATGDINFFQSVVIAAPTTIASSGGSVSFYRRAANGSVINAASGAGDSSLTILSGVTASTTVTPIRFNGSIGTTTNRLTSLTLGSSDSNFAANTRAIPNVASIVFTDAYTDAGEIVAANVAATDAFTVATGAGGFNMNLHEKLTAFGGININTQGAAFVSDMSAISNIRIDATAITLRGRDSGSVLEPQAGILQNQTDFGLDFVADQSINFNAPTTLNGGNNASFAVSDAAAQANPNAILINGSTAFTFLRGTFSGGVNPGFFAAPIGATNLTPLDLRSGGTNTSVATALAGAIPRDQETRQVTTPVTVSRALQEVLVPMGISLRDLTDEQIVTFLVGRSLYNDVPQRVAAQTAADFKVTPNRLSNAGALRAIAAYRALATTQVVGEDGAVTYVPRTAEVQTALEESWYRYLDECDKTQETPTGAGWRRWLENPAAEGKAEEDAKALESLNLCRDYFQRLEELNLSPREVRIPRDRIIAEIKPGLDELTVDEFLAAVTGNPMARAVPERVNPAQPGEVQPESAEVVGS